MKIQDRTLSMEQNYLDPVTYIPSHAKGNAQHEDAEQGVIINFDNQNVKVLYCKSRTVQATDPDDLVWG